MFGENSVTADETERMVKRARLQQEIARLEQDAKILHRGICPLSNLRVGECAKHSDHVPQLEAHHADLQRLYKEDKEYSIA